MGTIVLLLVLHLICTIANLTCAIISPYITSKVLYSISSVLWGLLTISDIIKLI